MRAFFVIRIVQPGRSLLDVDESINAIRYYDFLYQLLRNNTNNRHSNDNFVTRIVVPDLTCLFARNKVSRSKSILATRYNELLHGMYKSAFESCCESFAVLEHQLLKTQSYIIPILSYILLY